MSSWRGRSDHGSLPGTTTASSPRGKFRHPAGVIQHAVRLYQRFSFSLRFGRLFAKALKRRRPRLGDKRFLDEAFIRIGGKPRYLWRAVDQDGYVLGIVVQSRRSAGVAKRFSRTRLAGLQCVRG